MLFHDGRNEAEAVIFDRKRSLAPIDGTPEEWQAGHKRRVEARKREEAQFRASMAEEG